MNNFSRTLQGKQFFAQVGSIARSLERIAEALEKNLEAQKVQTPEEESPDEYIGNVQDNKAKVQHLVDKGICVSMAEARRVVASGSYDKVIAKHNKEA